MKQETKLSEMDLLKNIVEDAFNVNLTKQRRNRDIVDCRKIFSKILRERGHTFKSIGNYLNKDHSTIIHYSDEASNLINTDNKILELYITCRDKFLDNTEPIVSRTNRNLEREILSLQSQVNELLLQREEIKNKEKKYERLSEIINLINNRTPIGSENEIKRKLNEMFNE